jgi:hypothetical protein
MQQAVMYWKLVLVATLGIVLNGCSREEGKMKQLTDPVKIRSEVERVNINWTAFPVYDRFKGQVKRWKIPVSVYGETDELITEAVQLINDRAGMALLKVVAHEEKSGIRISYGTAVMPKNPPKDMTKVRALGGTVSGFVGEYHYGRDGITLDNGEIKGEVVINLINKGELRKKYKEDSILLVVHEFGHALGLFDHVNSIFDAEADKPINDGFYDLLIELYK